MRTLALDVGTRRTGAAFLDDATGVPLPLDTLHHTSQEELVTSVMQIVDARSIDRVIIGLPLLPSGDEGEQAAVSRAVGYDLQQRDIPVHLVDERHTTPRTGGHKHAVLTRKIDGDAAAALALLSGKIDC